MTPEFIGKTEQKFQKKINLDILIGHLKLYRIEYPSRYYTSNSKENLRVIKLIINRRFKNFITCCKIDNL